MADLSPLSPLEGAITSLVDVLRRQRVPAILIGGVAASLLGRPRATRDVDALVWIRDPEEWPLLLTALRAHGFDPRIPDALAFARKSRVLLVRHTASGIDVDVAFAALPFEEAAIRGASERALGSFLVPLPTPEDLVIMKAIASRPRDIADIEAIVDVHPDLDRRRVRAQVEDFAAALDAPELVTSLDRVLERTPVPKTSRTAPRARGTPRERPPRPRRAKASPRTP
ncbi:nucleotidyl transferase AbiEii/AbiGii toxin family protein, partial [Myxococcota bacterium]|nr:nucleotidyl transferase AbiEii/AbiGii toxin family protein [Myxococcota bacterium]